MRLVTYFLRRRMQHTLDLVAPELKTDCMLGVLACAGFEEDARLFRTRKIYVSSDMRLRGDKSSRL